MAVAGACLLRGTLLAAIRGPLPALGVVQPKRKFNERCVTVALDLFSPLKVVSWASAHTDCPMRYKINSADEMVLIFGSDSDEFEFSFETGALRRLVQLGSEALHKMDASTNERRDKLVATGKRSS